MYTDPETNHNYLY